MDKSALILQSWQANADNWIATIDNKDIESRKLVTNAAIIDTICQYNKGSILDIGCGEGWLTRLLQEKGFAAHGIDGVGPLVENAKRKGGASYSIGTYSDIVNKKVLFPQAFDSAVINFALLDKDESEKLLLYMPTLLKNKGLLFIQTLHPFTIASSEYRSGWKEGSWTGLKQKFVLPYQWYFRTIQDWCLLFAEAGLCIIDIKEPIHPGTQKPASIVFVLKAP